MSTSTYKQIMDEVKDQIAGLSLSGVSSGNIKLMKVSTDRKREIASLPAVLVSPYGQPTSITGTPAATVSQDVIQYPVAVVCVQASNQHQTTNFDRMTLWLEQIRKEFQFQPIAAVTAGNCYTCEVDLRDAFEPSAWFNNLDVGGRVLRFNAQETRS